MHPAFPPDSAPLEVDRVEWVPASPEAVHVRLYGRWRDRPVSEPLVLLVGDGGRRRGFDALGDPPAGALAAFAVPNELRPRLGEDLALQIGAHELELPGATAGLVGEEAPEGEAEVIDRAVLAERRARRAELAEEALVRRATTAEQTATTLEAQLANLEERLGGAREERDELESRVAEAERRLRAAEQREYAEQQQRIEAEDELETLRRGQEGALAELRGRLAAANGRAETLAREVDRARRAAAEATQQAEADRASLRRAEEALRAREEGTAAVEADVTRRLAELEAAERSLAEVQGRADEIDATLAAERSARLRAEAALSTEREAARAKVTLLEHELDDRRATQGRIAGQVAELRAELERLRASAAEHERTRGMVAKVEDAAVRLKDRVVDLERRKAAAERELAQVRDVLTARSTELERARIDLERATRDADAARASAQQHAAALEQAKLTIDAVRQSAGELQLQLDVERRERAQVEAALHEQLARERAEGQRRQTDAEVELRGEVAAQRHAVQQQIAAIEQHVTGLREQLTIAAARLRDELDTERAARQAAERQLAEERGRLEAERVAAATALVELGAERRRAAELQAEVTEAQRALREQVERVRADQAGREGREADVQRLVGDVLRTSASLREGFEREIRQLEGELTERIVSERREAAAELEALEAQVADLQARLEESGAALDADLGAERTARFLAEAELARERQRSGTAGADEDRAARVRLEAELEGVRAELSRVRAAAASHEARSVEAQSVISDLQQAAERLREETPPFVEEDDDAAAAPAAPPRVAAGEAPPASPAAPPAVEPPVAAAPEAPPATRDAQPAPGAEPDEPHDLRPNLVLADDRPRTPWVAPAIARLAALDPQAAARLVVALLPAQRLAVRGDVSYDLTVEELGTFRVRLHPGATTVEPRVEPGDRKDVDFHLAGPAAVLSEFAGGGIRRRPRGTRVAGSKRKLRRLLKDLRDPVGLEQVQASGAQVEPGLLLGALAAAIEPGWTLGHAFTIVWRVGEGTWHVRITDGLAPIAVRGLPKDEATATVHVSENALLPLLAGLPAPSGSEARVEGNAHAVGLLRQWFDQAQGLA